MTTDRLLDWIAAAILMAALACASASPVPADEQGGALCSTDSECAALCPAGDDFCDGGPEPIACETFDCWE